MVLVLCLLRCVVVAGDVRPVYLVGRGQVAPPERPDRFAAARLRRAGGGALELQDGEVPAGQLIDTWYSIVHTDWLVYLTHQSNPNHPRGRFPKLNMISPQQKEECDVIAEKGWKVPSRELSENVSFG